LIYTPDNLKQEQNKDAHTKAVIDYIILGNKPEDPLMSDFVRSVVDNCLLENDILYYHDKRYNQMKLFVPKSMRNDILEAHHDVHRTMELHRTKLTIVRSRKFIPNTSGLISERI